MDIGQPVRIHTIEPAVIPVPERERESAPSRPARPEPRRVPDPTPTPERVPEPARKD